jgi:hypothetical protein
MGSDVRTPRSRGALCGLMLVLLGAWGGVAPFAGPAFAFGYRPDQAWAYTSGRVFLSAVPGAVVVLSGLVVLLTRSRWLGGFCAIVAALGGAWFVAGQALIQLLPASMGAASVRTGAPLAATASRTVLTSLASFTGVGALVVFFAAIALGRFSVTALRDQLEVEEVAGDPVLAATGAGFGAGGTGMPAAAQATQPYVPGQSGYVPQYPAQFPAQEVAQPANGYRSQSPFPPAPDPYAAAADPYPAAADPYPAAADAYPIEVDPHPTGPDTFPAVSSQYPTAAAQYTAAQYPATSQYPPDEQHS